MNTAACSTQPLTAPARVFRLIPAGQFRAVDGRPQGLPCWTMDSEAARQIIATVSALAGDVVIDYEHQTLKASTNGTLAPAAGWFKELEWREGDGLYVMDARWTENAAAMLTAREYRYISPVFSYGQASGRVISIHSAAITNTPALDGLTDLAAANRKGFATMQPEGISANDHAKLQHIFGADYAQRAAAHEAAACAAALPPDGISDHDHAKLQAVFGEDYAIRMQGK
ncbi:phage protease [Craterilacuibacter sinensis]|uniref:Mu-like prophage I protein n=1 Tax=Craterilacuibacter sinensis TaxID=2686017 RepID=A0A845BMR7_9NEIS|nr:phage protease [Craterilacuibacter sinensis]MXR36690.1 hypothetical protein [Craterilacuibacter sinensis]